MTTLIDRYAGAIRGWLVFAPSIIGFYPLTGFINPLWGSLSGWPLYLVARSHPVTGPHPLTELIALIGGPLLMIAFRVWLSSRLLRWHNALRPAVVILWAMSALAVVPFDQAPRLFGGWPIWCACE